MPTPGYMPPRMPNALTDEFERLTAGRHLAAEIAALREEIAALRAELRPVPSLILTGREVLDEFKSLKRNSPTQEAGDKGGAA